MKNLIKATAILFATLIFTSYTFQNEKTTYSLTVEVNGLRNSKGVVQFALYNKDGSIPDEDYKKYFKKLTIKINNGSSSVTFDNLPSGKYAVNILHDENYDGKIKKGFILGSNLYAVLNHNFNLEEIDLFVKKLNENIEEFPEINNYLKKEIKQNPQILNKNQENYWEYVTYINFNKIDVIGPGIRITFPFNKSVCWYSNGTRWNRMFLSEYWNNHERIKLRKMVFEINSFLNNNNFPVLYSSDEGVLELIYEKSTLSELIEYF